MSNVRLCINVDHIATIRQQRRGLNPDPVVGAQICEESGADGITVHLREDRRHIQDRDVFALKGIVMGKYNLEMAMSDDVISVAKKVMPDQVTLVPEKREELTTEGGLDVRSQFKRVQETVKQFKDLGILVSLFIEPDKNVVEKAKEAGADYIEIHTGTYANAKEPATIDLELARISAAAEYASEIGLRVNGGHGLDVYNVKPILKMRGLEELHIGYSIIAQAIFIGLPTAVRELKAVLLAE